MKTVVLLHSDPGGFETRLRLNNTSVLILAVVDDRFAVLFGYVLRVQQVLVIQLRGRLSRNVGCVERFLTLILNVTG